MDLKKHIKNPNDQVNTKDILLNLGFFVEESRENLLVRANDPGRQQLISLFDAGTLNISNFIAEAKKRFDHKITVPDQQPIILLCGKPFICSEIIEEQTLPLKPVSTDSGTTKPSVSLHQQNLQVSIAKLVPLEQLVGPVETPAGTQTTEPPRHETTGQDITPLWRNLPPTDPEDWVEVDAAKYLDRQDGWAIAAASRRGKTHAHDGSHRDDSFDFDCQSGWSIIAAADGAGSYRLSRVGAKISCQVAVQNLKFLLENFELPELADAVIPEEADLLKIKQFLILTMQKVIHAVKSEAAKRGVEFDLLSTTVMIVIHHKWKDKSLVASIQVGDGAVAVWHGGSNVAILGKADTGDFASETKFITSKGIMDELEHKVFFTIKHGVDAVAVMTDGVADDFFPAVKVMPGMFEHIYNDLVGSEKPDENLLQWLAYERRGSFDDRTIVILHRR